jgi:hypothetical protein
LWPVGKTTALLLFSHRISLPSTQSKALKPPSLPTLCWQATQAKFLKEHLMKVQTGIKAGRQGVEASHGGKPRPIGKGV